MGLPFHILDVFTTGRPMSGNQLLVVEDHEDTLSTEAMQAIAKEIGFAESAFVRKADTSSFSAAVASVRIFTIDEEVPQAGHPIVGLSEIVGSSVEAKKFTMLTKKGPIVVRQGAAGNEWFASQDPCDFMGNVSAASVKALLSHGASDLNAYPDFKCGSTCGLPYALVPMQSEAALDALVINPAAPPEDFQRQCDLPNGLALYFYYRNGEASFRTRMFCFEGDRWIEDVATGSAAGPLAAFYAPFTGTFTQGSTRRAHIRVKSTTRDSRVEVGGAVLRVASGEWAAIPTNE